MSFDAECDKKDLFPSSLMSEATVAEVRDQINTSPKMLSRFALDENKLSDRQSSQDSMSSPQHISRHAEMAGLSKFQTF